MYFLYICQYPFNIIVVVLVVVFVDCSLTYTVRINRAFLIRHLSYT